MIYFEEELCNRAPHLRFGFGARRLMIIIIILCRPCCVKLIKPWRF